MATNAFDDVFADEKPKNAFDDVFSSGSPPATNAFDDVFAEAPVPIKDESSYRNIAAKYLGTGTTAQRIAGQDPGLYESVKGNLNQLTDSRDALATALRDSDGDIDKAIELAKETHRKASVRSEFDTMGDNPFGMFQNIEAAKTSPVADQLSAMKAELDAAGVSAEDRPRILQDAARANAWTEKDEDNVRQLSTGELVINPGRLFGQKDQIIADINASNASSEEKANAIERFDVMRKAAASKVSEDLSAGDVGFFGVGDFQSYLDDKVERGQSDDTVALLDDWIAQKKDRNFALKFGDAVVTGMASGEIGIAKTVAGALAGVSAAAGLPGAETLGGAQQFLGDTQESLGKAEKTRGQAGLYGVTSDIANTVTQMLPMFAGGAYAQGLEGLSQTAVRGMSVYGWAAAQGYESKLAEALRLAEEKKGSALTPQEVTQVLGSGQTQIAALLNGFQTAILSKVLGGGAERAALGQAAKSMTVRDFIAGGGAKALRDGTLKTELKSMARTVRADASDEGVEELMNQLLDGAISVVALGKDMKLGDLLEESSKAGLLSVGVGGVLPQIQRSPSEEVALDLAAGAAAAAPQSAAAATAPLKVPLANETTKENPPLELPVPPVPIDQSGTEGASAAPVSETGLPPADGTAVPAKERDPAKVKMVVRILARQGVDPDIAREIAGDLIDDVGETANAEDFREKAVNAFRQRGGVMPNESTTYSEDAASYEASGDTPEEAAQKVENAKAFNALQRSQADDTNRGLVGQKKPAAPEGLPESPAPVKTAPSRKTIYDMSDDEILAKEIEVQQVANQSAIEATDESGPGSARDLADTASKALAAIRAEIDKRKKAGKFSPSVNEPTPTTTTPIAETPQEDLPPGVPETGVQPPPSGPAVAGSEILGTPRPGFTDQFVTPEGATIELLPDGKASFIVPPDQRGKGAGNAAVERVKQYADTTGTTIQLDIEPLGNEPGMNRAELADWYERRGFTVSEDRLSAEYEPSPAPTETVVGEMNDFQKAAQAVADKEYDPRSPEFFIYDDTFQVDPSRLPDGAKYFPEEGEAQYYVPQRDGSWNLVWKDLEGSTRVSKDTPPPTQSPNEQNTEGQPGQETAPETAQAQAPVEGGAQGMEAGGEGAVKWTEHQGEAYPDFLDNIKNGRYDPETAIDWLFRYGGLRNRKDAEKYYEALTHSKRGNPPATLSPTEYVDSQFVPASIYNRGGYPEDVAKDDHRYMVEDALESQETVSAEAVDSYGIKLPEGYVRKGELYVFQPTQSPNEPDIPNEVGGVLYEGEAARGSQTKQRPNQAADLEWWLGALGKVEGLNAKERAHTRLIVEGKENKGTHAYATINRPPSQIALGHGRAYDEQGIIVTDAPLSIDEQMSLQVVPVDSETTTSTAKQLFAKGFELENNGKTYLVTPSTTSSSLRVTELDAEGPTGHIHLDNRWFVSDLRKYLLGAKVFDERTPDTTPPVPEFGNPPVNLNTTEPLDPNPPPPELPNFEDALADDSVTGLYHAQTDADRARLGLPPRFKQPRTTDQDAWDRATAAEDAHRAAGKPGTAGTDLLTNLLNDVPRVLTKNEHALLLHEKLVREQAVEAAQSKLNSLPAGTPDGVRKDAQAAVKSAQDAFDLLVTYADAAGSAAGLSLQARKMLVNMDFSLAAVVNRLKAAANMKSDAPVKWTEKDQKAAVEIAEKLQQAQERVDALEAENSEQVALIEQLTKDVERAQTKLENRMRTSRARSLVKEKLDPLVEAAKARMAERRKAPPTDENAPLYGLIGPTPEMVEDLKDIAIISAGWVADKALTLQEFSSRLVAEFGDWVAEHAQSIFRQARSLYIETAESVSGGNAPTPESVVKDIDPAEPLDKTDVWALARAHVVAGKRGRNVLDAVFGDLSSVFPNLTRDEVAEAFTGYGTVVYPSTKAVPAELRRIRSLEREYLKQADIRAGQMPKRTGYQGDAKKGPEWAEVRAEQQRTADALRELENQLREAGLPVPSDERKLANALNTKKRRLTNEIEEIELALKSKTPRTPKSRTPIADDAEVRDLEKRLAEKRAEYEEVFKDESAREKRILGSLKKRRMELERRINEKDFSRPEVKPPVNTEAKRKAEYEFAKVRAKFEEMRHKYILENAPLPKKVGHYVMSGGNLLKILTLGGDIGVVMRQLGTTYQAITRDLGMLAPTKEGAKRREDGSYLKRIISEGVKSFGSAEYEHTAYERLMERQNAGWDKTAGLVLSAPFDIQRNSKEDIPAANLLDKIPWWMWPALAGLKVSLLGTSFPVSASILALGAVTKPFMQALDRAQRTMTNQSRAMFFDAALAALHDGNPTVQEAKAIAKAVMVGTGRGTATQKIESAIPFANQVILATRYYISRIQALTLYPLLNKDARASRDAQREISRMYARSVAGRAVLYGLAAMAFGKALTGDDDDPEEGLIIDPRNPNFGRVKLANGVSLDFMSGLNNFASAAARYFGKVKVDPTTGKKEVLGPGFTNNVNDEALRFLRSKLNIQFSFLVNTHAGEYFGGKPVNLPNALEEITTAIIVNDTFNTYKAMMEEYGPTVGAARASLFLGMMFGGAGTSVLDSEAEKEANRIAKKEADMNRKMIEAEINE